MVAQAIDFQHDETPFTGIDISVGLPLRQSLDESLEKEDDIHDIIYAILESTLSVIGLQTGWVYLRDPERNVYHLASWYGVSSSQETCLLHEKSMPICHCQTALVTGELPQDASIQRCERLQAC